MVAGHTRDEIVVCPPYIDLYVAAQSTKGSNVDIGAQDLYWERGGVHRRNLPGHALDVGCTHAIIGHSERSTILRRNRRHGEFQAESCAGSRNDAHRLCRRSSGEREANLTETSLRRHVFAPFTLSPARKQRNWWVAYEPVLAIGTGKDLATPQLASAAHLIIRGEKTRPFGSEFSERLRILYGGSVKPENVKGLMAEEEIDGALVGGASLDPKSFAAIVKY